LIHHHYVYKDEHKRKYKMGKKNQSSINSIPSPVNVLSNSFPYSSFHSSLNISMTLNEPDFFRGQIMLLSKF